MLKLWTGEAMPRSKSFVDALVWRLMTVGVPKVPGTAFASPPEFGHIKNHLLQSLVIFLVQNHGFSLGWGVWQTETRT